jgi:hypothetical protein
MISNYQLYKDILVAAKLVSFIKSN